MVKERKGSCGKIGIKSVGRAGSGGGSFEASEKSVLFGLWKRTAFSGCREAGGGRQL